MSKEKIIQQEGELPCLTPSELLPILIGHAKAGESVGIEGPPGGGKSEIVAQAAMVSGKPILAPLNLELSDSTDLKGLPSFTEDKNWHHWAKDKRWSPDYPFTNFMDELPRGSIPAQGAACMALLENRIDDLFLPKGTWHVWAGNRTSDKAGANRVPSIVYQRSYMYELAYCAKSQVEWMLGQPDCDLLTMRFLRHKGDEALSFDPAKKINPTPRSWTRVARKLFQNSYTPFATIAGTIGKGLASELLSFRALAPTLPTPEEVIMTPLTAPMPNNPSAQFLIGDMLVDHSTINTFDAIVEYAKRMPEEMQAKFMSACMERKQEVKHTRAFTTWGVKFAGVLS